MSTSTFEQMTLDVSQSIEIGAPIGNAWTAMMRQLGSENTTPDNRPMPMVLEQWPGGRWFRDLGTGQGHLWGFVQVIKPPTLIEIHGPLFMSYAVAGHVQVRLAPIANGAEVFLRHRVLGMIQEEHRDAISHGWQSMLDKIKDAAE